MRPALHRTSSAPSQTEFEVVLQARIFSGLFCFYRMASGGREPLALVLLNFDQRLQQAISGHQP